MEFNNNTQDSIISEITFLTGVDINNYSLEDRTRHVNEAYNRVAHLIIQSDGSMSWDDTNYSTLPVATADLIKDERDYNLFSNAPADLKNWLVIHRIDAQDTSDNWYQMIHMDQSDWPYGYDEFREDSSIPRYFDYRGSVLTLHPAPDYDKTDALKIFFQRGPSFFDSTDTTKEPGFANTYHHYLPLYAAYKWTLKTGQQDQRLKRDLQELENAIQKHYNRRGPKMTIRRKVNNYK